MAGWRNGIVATLHWRRTYVGTLFASARPRRAFLPRKVTELGRLVEHSLVDIHVLTFPETAHSNIQAPPLVKCQWYSLIFYS